MPIVQHIAVLGDIPSPRLDDLAPLLLLGALLVVVGIGGLFLGLILRQSRRTTTETIPKSAGPFWRSEGVDWQPLFDSPFRWLAIRSEDATPIQAALGLRNARACSWEEGLNRAMEHRLFISPPVNGWILVMGVDLPDPADDPDECFHFLNRLSGKLGEVQFFSINRLFSHHAWVMARDGIIERGYAHAGQTLWNQGDLTAAEVALRVNTYDYCQVPEKSFFTHVDPLGATTEKVTSLAARWSVDPTKVDFRRMKGSRGISGRFHLPSPPPTS